MRQAIIWTNDSIIYWRIYASLGRDELTVIYIILEISIHVIIDDNVPDNKVHEANMGPTWVLSDPDGPHVGPMNLAIRAKYGCRCMFKTLSADIDKVLSRHIVRAIHLLLAALITW